MPTEEFTRKLENLKREVARPIPEFSTFDPHYLKRYQQHVVRWAHCAPEGAVLLPAPLCGWRGEAFSPRPAQGPADLPCERLRAAYVARGLDPLNPIERKRQVAAGVLLRAREAEGVAS